MVGHVADPSESGLSPRIAGEGRGTLWGNASMSSVDPFAGFRPLSPRASRYRDGEAKAGPRKGGIRRATDGHPPPVSLGDPARNGQPQPRAPRRPTARPLAVS